MGLEWEQHWGVGPRVSGVMRVPVGAGGAVGQRLQQHRVGIPTAWRGTPKPTEEGRREDVAQGTGPAPWRLQRQPPAPAPREKGASGEIRLGI